MTSLPDAQADPALLVKDKKTELTNFDPGWIRSSDGGVEPKAHFDYTAEGWQTLRVTERAQGGGLDSSRQVTSDHYADGALKEERDRDGQPDLLHLRRQRQHDEGRRHLGRRLREGVAHGHERDLRRLRPAAEGPREEAEGCQLGATTYTHDLNGNEETRVEDAEESEAGSQVKPGRRFELTYEANDWLKTQLDRGESAGATDDRRLTRTYFADGTPRDDVMATSDSAGAYATKQQTLRTYFQNQLPKTTQTKNGAGTVLESHTLSYHDASGVYQDGNKAKDAFTRQGPSTSAPCRTTACNQTFAYDARGRVKRSDDGHGAVTDYKLDAPGNVTEEATTKGGTTTRETQTFQGNQLRTQTTAAGTAAAKTSNFFHDAEGKLDCQTTQTGSKAACSPAEGAPARANLIADYAHDGKNRTQSFRSFGAGAKSAKYSYDAFDRPTEQTDKSAAGESTKLMSYVGLSDQTAGEEHRSGQATGALKKSKAYSYDPDGQRLGMTETPAGATGKHYGYAHDSHGSTSMLIGEGTQKAQASYGYSAYGEEDKDLTKESDPADATGATATKPEDPLNSYRYSAKRSDPSSGTLDMGARRYAPKTSSFVQEDTYDDALDDLDLATDPLTQNRYALAAGNPVNFIEVDGHEPVSSFQRDRQGRKDPYYGRKAAPARKPAPRSQARRSEAGERVGSGAPNEGSRQAASNGGSGQAALSAGGGRAGGAETSQPTSGARSGAQKPKPGSSEYLRRCGDRCSGRAEEVDDFDYLGGPQGVVGKKLGKEAIDQAGKAAKPVGRALSTAARPIGRLGKSAATNTRIGNRLFGRVRPDGTGTGPAGSPAVKGLLNRGPIRAGLGWRQPKGHPGEDVFRIGIGKSRHLDFGL